MEKLEKYIIVDYGEYDYTNHRYKDRPTYLEFIGSYNDKEDVPYMTYDIKEAQVFYSWRDADRFIKEYLDGRCKVQTIDDLDSEEE